MEQFASGLDEDARDRERSQLMEKELNITDFQVEPEMEKVMTDFFILPYPDPKQVDAETPHPVLPFNFYDNDDGFWDSYIRVKEDKWAANQMIVNRKFLKH